MAFFRRVTAFLFILSNLVLAGETCETYFKTELEQAQKAVYDLEKALTNKAEIKKKDPRWFSALRDEKANPYELKLKTELQTAEQNLLLLKDQVQVYKKLAFTAEQISKLTFEDKVVEAQIHEWFNQRVIEIRTDLAAPLKNREKLIFITQRIGQLDLDRSKLESMKSDSFKVMQNYKVMLRFELMKLSHEHASVIESVLGRSLREEVFHDLLALSEARSIPFKTVLENFKKVSDSNSSKKIGLDDYHIAILTKYVIEKNKAPEEVINLYKSIEGKVFNEKLSLYEIEVLALVDISLEKNISAGNIVKRLKELREAVGDKIIDSTALVVLAKLSFDSSQVTPQDLVRAVFELSELRRTKASEITTNDLGLSILAQGISVQHLSPQDIIQNFKAYWTEIQNKSTTINSALRTHTPEEIARWVQIGISHELTPAELIEIASKINYLVTYNVSTKSLEGLIRDSLIKAKIAGIKVPTGEMMAASVRQILTQQTSMLSIIRNEMNKQRDAERMSVLADARRAKRQVRETIYRVVKDSVGGGSREDSSTDISFNTSYNIDEGFKPGLNLMTSRSTGIGVGIDLTDGSLTIKTGGVVIDTDGDGIGFKMF